MPRVLALGLYPRFADYSHMPALTPERVGAFIESQLQLVRDAGYEVDSCLVDTGDWARRLTARTTIRDEVAMAPPPRNP